MRLGYYVSRGNDPYALTTQPVPALSMPGVGALPSIGYPPLWALMQAAVYRLYSIIGVDNRFLYYFLIKQEMIIGDLIVAFLLYRIVRMHAPKEDATSAFVFWMLCPLTIIFSAVWGMFDQLTLALVLLSFLSLSSTVTSSAIEGVGVLLKGIPLIFLPALAAAQRSASRRLVYVGVAVAVAVSLSLAPYLVFHTWSLSRLFETGFSTVNKVNNSINLWVIVYVWYNLSPLPGYLSTVMTWAGYLWIAALLGGYAFCFHRIRLEGLERRLVTVMLVATLLFYLTRTNVNEQYVVYFLGFALIDRYWNGPARGKLFSGVWLSALSFLVFNNVYLTRFFSPLSGYYTSLDVYLVTGPAGEFRFAGMIACGIAFTLFCLLYLRSLISEMGARGERRGLGAPAAQAQTDGRSRAPESTPVCHATMGTEMTPG